MYWPLFSCRETETTLLSSQLFEAKNTCFVSIHLKIIVFDTIIDLKFPRSIFSFTVKCGGIHCKKKGVLRNGKKVLAFATSSEPSQTVYYILINHYINLHIYPKYPFFKGLLDVFPIRSLSVSFFEPSRFHFLPLSNHAAHTTDVL